MLASKEMIAYSRKPARQPHDTQRLGAKRPFPLQVYTASPPNLSHVVGVVFGVALSLPVVSLLCPSGLGGRVRGYPLPARRRHGGVPPPRRRPTAFVAADAMPRSAHSLPPVSRRRTARPWRLSPLPLAARTPSRPAVADARVRVHGARRAGARHGHGTAPAAPVPATATAQTLHPPEA